MILAVLVLFTEYILPMRCIAIRVVAPSGSRKVSTCTTSVAFVLEPSVVRVIYAIKDLNGLGSAFRVPLTCICKNPDILLSS
jgi:hypothetical protein